MWNLKNTPKSKNMYTPNLEKESRFVVTRGGGWGKWKKVVKGANFQL